MQVGNKKIRGINKFRGALYEQWFITEAMSKGYIPHSPALDPDCHDLIVMDQRGELSITQVKSVTVPSKRVGNGIKFSVKATCHNGATSLKDSFVDVLAVYAPKYQKWYIIPTKAISAKTVNLFPHIDDSGARYEKFIDRWDIFGASEDVPAL